MSSKAGKTVLTLLVCAIMIATVPMSILAAPFGGKVDREKVESKTNTLGEAKVELYNYADIPTSDSSPVVKSSALRYTERHLDLPTKGISTPVNATEPQYLYNLNDSIAGARPNGTMTNVLSQVKNGDMYNAKNWTGSKDPTPQDLDATAGKMSKTLNIDMKGNVNDSVVLTTGPAGAIPSIQTRANDTTPDLERPAGIADITGLTSDSTFSLTKPTGSVGITPYASNGTSKVVKPKGLQDNTIKPFVGIQQNVAPLGAHPVYPQTTNMSPTIIQPAGAPLSSSGTYYFGNFSIDGDENGVVDSVCWVVLTDVALPGIYNTLDLSINDFIFGEGPQNDFLVDWGTGPGGNTNDEEINVQTDIHLGNNPLYTVSFDANPTTDNDDVRIQTKEWYTGTYQVDANGDMAMETVQYSEYDENSDGVFESVDLSLGDNTFGQGALDNTTLVVGDDETLNGTSKTNLLGPDGGGYYWTPNAVYDWIEINNTGTNMTLGDESSTNIDIPFNFTYYGNEYNQTMVCSNGWITFNLTDTVCSWSLGNVPDSSIDGYYGILSFLGKDLDQDNGGENVYETLGTAPNRMFVVEFWDVGNWNPTGNPKTGEIILYEGSNNIKMQWKELPDYPDAVGIENDNGTWGIGTGASGDLWINMTNITNGTAYEFFPSMTTSSFDVTIGNYLFRVERAAAPSTSPFSINVTNKEWFTGIEPFDGNETGTTAFGLSYALSDQNSDGIYERLDLSMNGTYGYGNLGNLIVNLTDGERLAWSGSATTMTIGPTLPFDVVFDRDPAADASDVRITALRYFTGTFMVDSDADSLVDDTYNYVLTDTNSDGMYDTIELSIDTTYGQGALGNKIVGAGDDERMTMKGNVRMGNDIVFTLSTSGAPSKGVNDLTVENLFTYKGNMSFDANLDGKMNEQLYFVISDANSDGIYETLDLSFDPIFGEGVLNDGIVTSKPYNDEEISHDSDVQLAKGMNFNVSFDKDPMKDNSDIRIKVKVWFEGMFKLDASNSGQANDKLYYVLSDTNSDGFMDTLDLSLGDETFGEGALNDGTVASLNDERLVKEGVVTIGTMQFSANFTGSPLGLAVDAWLKNTDIFKGTFNVDMGVNGNAQDVIDYVISDSDADGLYDTIDLSLGNDVYRQDLSHDGYVDTSDNDETMTNPGDVRIGPFVYSLDFIWNPAGTNKDVTLTSKQWYLGNFMIDADGDGVANETVYFLLSDLDSNGVYDTMDQSLSDKDFGQGTLDDEIVDQGNDERIAATTELDVGVQNMEARFTPSPNQNIEDAFMKDIGWYTGTIDGAGWTLYYAICDKGSDGVFDTVELSTNAVFGEGDTADMYIQPSNDEITTDGAMIIRGTFHYVVFVNKTMGGLHDVGLKGEEWRTGKWTVEGMSRSVAVSDANSDGKFDTIHIDLNDDGSFDGPNDLTGGIDGFRGTLMLTYAVASSNDDGTMVDMAPINATTGDTNGWMVGNIGLDGMTMAVAVSDKNADNKYETVDIDGGNGVIAFTGLNEANNVSAVVHGKGYRVMSVPASGAYVKLVAFTDAIAGSALDRSVSGTLFFGKVSEASVGMDLNDDSKMTGSLVALVIDITTTGPMADRYVLYLDTNLNGDLGDEVPLMLGSVFDMGSTQWKVDNIASDRKEVGLMRMAGPVAKATTGPDGAFSLSPPDGTYWVRTSSQQAGWGYRLFEDTNAHHGYKVSGAGITDKEIVLSPSATSMSGIVTDMITGEPIGGVKVEVYSGDGVKIVSTLTLADGSYLLGVARNMVFDVVFSKAGYQTDDGTKSNGTWHGLGVASGRNDVNVALMPVPSPDILTFVEPADGTVVSGEILVKVKVTDVVKVDKVMLTVNGGITWIDMTPGTGNEFSTQWNTKLGPSGNYKITARAVNGAGLRVDKGLGLKVDNSGPSIVFTTAQQQYGNVMLSVKATDDFSDVKSVEVRVDGGAWKTMTKGDGYYYTWSSGPFDSGTHKYEVRATDSRGNVAVYSSKMTVDNTWMLLLIVMIVMLVVLVVVFIKKRKKAAPAGPAVAPAPPKEGAR